MGDCGRETDDDSMSSILLNNDRWKVVTGGTGRTLWSFISLNPSHANWFITDKKTGEEWRLSNEEHDFIGDIAERLNAVQFSPEFQEKSKTERNSLSLLVLADCLEAIAMQRLGDNSKSIHLANLNQAELTAHVFDLWDF